MFDHLLVPLDGSALAESALPVAMELASRCRSQITLLRIVAPPQLMTGFSLGDFSELLLAMRTQNVRDAEQYLRAHQGSLRQQGFRVHTHVAEDTGVASSLLQITSGIGADMIIMSTHGRGGLGRWVFGSVADRVLRRASVPVLLVRSGAGRPQYELPVMAGSGAALPV